MFCSKLPAAQSAGSEGQIDGVENMRKNRKIKIITLLSTVAVGVFALATLSVQPSEKVSASAPLGLENFTTEDLRFEGYSIRFDGNTVFGADDSGETALRFKTSISSALYSYLTSTEGAKTGTLIYPAYYLEDRDTQNLTVATQNGEVAPFNVDTTTSWKYIEGEDVYQSVAYLKEIPAKSYGFDVAARGYVQVGDNYYYTEGTPARSLAYVADKEYGYEDSVFTADQKGALRDALLKFPVTVDGVKTEKYYGEKIAPPTERTGYLFAGYRIEGRKEIWSPDETTVYGKATLTSVFVPTRNYYSLQEGALTIEIDGLPAGLTKAEVNGQEVACTSAKGKLYLKELTSLKAGDKYLVKLVDGEGKSYFGGFTAVTADLPYSFEDYLDFDFSDGGAETHRVASVKDDYGNDIAHIGACLEGIPANESSKPQSMLVYITDDHGDEYTFHLSIYTDVIYNNEDADAFFLGSISGTNVFWEDALVDQDLTGCYALASDVTLSLPLKHTRTTGGLAGLFDGRGHTVSWTTDAQVGDTKASPALFGYNFRGVIQNAAFDFTLTGNWNSGLCVLADYASAKQVTLENVYINLKTSYTVTQRDLAIFLWGSRRMADVVVFRDVVIVNSLAQHGLNSCKRMLWGYDRLWASNQFADGAEAYLGANNQISSSVVNMQNSYVIMNSGVKLTAASLAHASDGGTVYAENNRPEECNEKQGWYKGIFLYRYADAITQMPSTVGAWSFDFSDTIQSMTASYVY